MFKSVRILKGEHRSEEYAKINPAKLIPAIKDGDFLLAESHAIMRYICGSRNLPSNWYPSDPKKRALVDQYLDWHHTNLRQGVAGQVFKTVFGPMMGMKYTKEEVDVHKQQFSKSMRRMESWLS